MVWHCRPRTSRCYFLLSSYRPMSTACRVSTSATGKELPSNLLQRSMKENRERPSQKSNPGRVPRARFGSREPTVRVAACRRLGGILPPRMRFSRLGTRPFMSVRVEQLVVVGCPPFWRFQIVPSRRYSADEYGPLTSTIDIRVQRSQQKRDVPPELARACPWVCTEGAITVSLGGEQNLLDKESRGLAHDFPRPTR